MNKALWISILAAVLTQGLAAASDESGGGPTDPGGPTSPPASITVTFDKHEFSIMLNQAGTAPTKLVYATEQVTILGRGAKVDSDTAWFAPGASLRIETTRTNWPFFTTTSAKVYGNAVDVSSLLSVTLAGSVTAVTSVYRSSSTSPWNPPADTLAGQYSYELKADSTAPTFSLSAQGFNWSNQQATISIADVVENQSGLDSTTYSIDGQTATTVSGSTIVLPRLTHGNHTVAVTLTDKVGNKTTKSVVVAYDLAPPAVVPTPQFQAPADGLFSSLLITWTAVSDPKNALDHYEVFLDKGLGYQKLPGDVKKTDALSKSVAVGTADRGKQFSVVIFAVDTFQGRLRLPGDTGSASSLPLAVAVNRTFPAVMTASKPAAVLNAAQETKVRVTLSVDRADFLRNYERVVLTRVGDPAKPMPATLTSASLTFTTSAVLNSDLTFADARWSTEQVSGKERIVYTDTIPASVPAGNLSLAYRIDAAPKGQSGTELGGVSPAVVLPNHLGSLTSFSLVDQTGNPLGAATSLQQVYLEFTGQDLDQETWTVQGTRVSPAPGQTVTLTTYTPGTKTKVGPISLRRGVNTLSLTWNEIKGGVSSTSSSLTVEYTPVAVPGFSVVLDELETAPGETQVLSPVVTNPAGGPLTYLWDFGDGSAASTLKAPSHVWHRRPGEIGIVSVYQVSLIVTDESQNETSATAAVAVYDTSEGRLFEDETWNGPHMVSGRIVIPAGKTLTIAAGTRVEVSGTLGGGFNQALVVEGTLVVQNGAWLGRAEGQTASWDGILVQKFGRVSVGTAVIQDAVRGIAVGASGTAVLSGTVLSANDIGLHVVGSGAQVSATGIRLVGNGTYGVKEDEGRPTLLNSVFVGNGSDYYQWDYGALTMARVNGLGANSGNRRETE